MWLASRWLLPEMMWRSFGICYLIQRLPILSIWPIFWSQSIPVLSLFRYATLIHICIPPISSKFIFMETNIPAVLGCGLSCHLNKFFMFLSKWSHYILYSIRLPLLFFKNKILWKQIYLMSFVFLDFLVEYNLVSEKWKFTSTKFPVYIS